jgi:hypothetical protein
MSFNFNQVLTNNEIACAFENGFSVKKVNVKNFLTIDIHELKITFNKIWKQWFPFGEKNTTFAVGLLWSAFSLYVFPWMLDIAKCYCAFMIAQGFYKEHKGMDGKSGRSGFQSFIYYGKWLIIFHLIPVGVELLDQIGGRMLIDIKNGTLDH